MIKNNFIKILISIITIFLFLMIFYHVINQLINREEIIRPVDQEKFQGKATLIINNGIQSKIFTVNFKEEITAFDLLKDKAGELNMNLKTKTYNIGIFIEAIGDKENGQDGKYWLYYVNGEIPMIASNKYKIKNGDMVEFKFEESIF